MTALLDELAALLDRPDDPACLERLHFAIRACGDLRVDAAVRRHVARRTDTLVVSINDATFARARLVGHVAGRADADQDVLTLRADAAAARDRLVACLDAFHGDATITAAIQTLRG